MATINGTLRNADGTIPAVLPNITFRPAAYGPRANTGSVTLPAAVTVTPAIDGTFSIVLAGGKYWVTGVGGFTPTEIYVPTGGGTYRLEQLMSGPDTTVQTGAIYWGRNTKTTLGGSDVATLGSTLTVSAWGGTFNFAAGSGYLYLAFPAALGSPAAGNGFASGAFPVSMAAAADGYSGNVVNGWTYQPVTVGGTVYAVYRTQNQMTGAFNITVS
jgi:hypothetical protein